MVQWLRLFTSTAGGVGLIPGQRNKIPHAMEHGQKIKKKKKERNNATCSNMNGPRDYHAKRRKSERKTNTQPYPVLLICGILKTKKKVLVYISLYPRAKIYL